MGDFTNQVNVVIDSLRDEHAADFLIYAGEISRRGADFVNHQLEQRQGDNLILLLCTIGGDSHAAFKIARSCQAAYETIPKQHYKSKTDPTITVYVPTICKSAGTIIALGADHLMMSSSSELGPIDTQLRKPEEVGELTSTLTPLQTMQSLQRQTAEIFVETFSTLRFDEKVSFSTKMASESAKELARAIVEPIAGQIDPYRLAETERMLKISSEYGRRLSEGLSNLHEGALQRLLADYPSHGFVIDKAEASSLFRNVTEPSNSVFTLANLLNFLYIGQADSDPPYVRMIQPIDEPNGAGDEIDSDTTSQSSSTEKQDADEGDLEHNEESRPAVRSADAPPSKQTGSARKSSVKANPRKKK